MFIDMNPKLKETFPFVPTHVGFHPYQMDVHRPLGYRAHLFVWVNEGTGIFKAGDETRVLNAGQGLFVRDNYPYSYEAEGNVFATAYVAFFGGDNLFEHYNLGSYLFFDIPQFLNNATIQLEEICKTASAAMRCAHGCLWATELLEKISQSNLTFADSIMNYLNQNFERPITLDELAAQFKTDKYLLCHNFKKATDESVMQMLRRIRVQKAKHMLRYSGCPIEEVGKLCGYENTSYFIKIFKEDTGLTPGLYRKKRSAM